MVELGPKGRSKMPLPSTSSTLPSVVLDHLSKAREACVAAVENYNKPGRAFRTRTYTILMVIAWTALFHAIFHRRGKKPWYVERDTGPPVEFKRIDGDPCHWDLATCVRRYYLSDNPPQRKNLEFMVRLRNKIEHRDHPELDPALYGECQAMLMNFEELLTSKFGKHYAISGQLGLALQFSILRPDAQKEAIHRLQSSSATDLIDFIRHFRGDLPREVVESSSFSLRVFLVPKLANRQNSADLAVEFVPFDPTRPEQMDQKKKVAALLKEKHVPVASSGLIKPGEVVARLGECLPFRVTMHTHTRAWKTYNVRPRTDSEKPHETASKYCLYDQLSKSYGYTQAWVKHLCEKLRDPQEYERVTGAEPVRRDQDGPEVAKPEIV